MTNMFSAKKMTISQNQLKELKAAAIEVSKHSYSPYSKFSVGAAALTDSGHIVTGCNVENASYGLTICAERNAIFHAVSSLGAITIVAIAIYTPTERPSTPCGACRQVIFELGSSAEIYCFCSNEKIISTNIKNLLPDAFGKDSL